MQGLHLTADLTDCQCAPHWLTDAQALGQAVEAAVVASGLSAVGRLFHTFPGTAGQPGGVTATVLLAESHVCVHTWPEVQGATLDVYVCNFSGDHSEQAKELMTRLIARFKPMRAVEHTLHRGSPQPPLAPPLAGGPQPPH